MQCYSKDCTEAVPPLSVACVKACSASVSRLLALVTAVAGASVRPLDILKKTNWNFLRWRYKFSELHLLTEVRSLLYHHLQKVSKRVQSFGVLCNSSLPLHLQGWLGHTLAGAFQLSLALRVSRDSSRNWCGTGSRGQGNWLW